MLAPCRLSCVVYWGLFVVRCLSCAVCSGVIRSLLAVDCCLLLVVSCVVLVDCGLSVVRCLLFVDSGLLFFVVCCCLLSVVCY